MRSLLAFIVIIFILSLTNVLSAKDSGNIPQQHSNEYKLNIDTLKLQSIIDKSDTVPFYKNTNMPYFISVIIVLLSFLLNWCIAKMNERTVLKSIESSKDIAIKQIKNSQDVAILEFKTTLKTQNIQDWLNDIRNCISEFLSQCTLINVIMLRTNINEKVEELKPYFEKMIFNKNKIGMLLSMDEKDQKELFDSIQEMKRISLEPEKDYEAELFKKQEEIVVKNARHFFVKHWKNINDTKGLI